MSVLASAPIRQTTAAAQPATAVPILVELFTAEGCSSCPPADALLAKMIETQPATGVVVVGLGEHVDYWDQLGWKDRFSSGTWTARQQTYAARLKTADIYTPQMIVDGRDAFVGSDVNAARRAIEHAQQAPHGTIRIAQEAEAKDAVSVSVVVSGLPPLAAGDRAELFFAVTEGGLRSDVTRGENKGRALTHAAVVRELRSIGGAPTDTPARTTVKLGNDWRRDQLTLVAFVQEREGRKVLATAAVRLSDRR